MHSDILEKIEALKSRVQDLPLNSNNLIKDDTRKAYTKIDKQKYIEYLSICIDNWKVVEEAKPNIFQKDLENILETCKTIEKQLDMAKTQTLKSRSDGERNITISNIDHCIEKLLKEVNAYLLITINPFDTRMARIINSLEERTNDLKKQDLEIEKIYNNIKERNKQSKDMLQNQSSTTLSAGYDKGATKEFWSYLALFVIGIIFSFLAIHSSKDMTQELIQIKGNFSGAILGELAFRFGTILLYITMIIALFRGAKNHRNEHIRLRELKLKFLTFTPFLETVAEREREQIIVKIASELLKPYNPK